MKEFVRTILDYPVKGIQFRDITTLLQNSKHFEKVINQMTEPWKDNSPIPNRLTAEDMVTNFIIVNSSHRLVKRQITL